MSDGRVQVWNSGYLHVFCLTDESHSGSIEAIYDFWGNLLFLIQGQDMGIHGHIKIMEDIWITLILKGIGF